MNESEVSAILHSIPKRVQSIRCELGKRIYGQDELILMLLAGIYDMVDARHKQGAREVARGDGAGARQTPALRLAEQYCKV